MPTELQTNEIPNAGQETKKNNAPKRASGQSPSQQSPHQQSFNQQSNEQQSEKESRQINDKNSSTHSDSHSQMSGDETRQMLTPFAFEIDKSLFGLPLASPMKRAIAITIDGLLIAMLSGAPGELLAIVIAVTLYRLGSQKRADEMGYTKGRKRRKFMRFIAAFTTFIVLLSILPDMFNGLGWSESNKYYDSGKNEYADKVYQELNAEKGEEIAATIGDKILFSLAIGQAMSALSEDECMDADCWYQALAPSVATLDETSLTMAEKKEVIKQSLAEIDVPEGQYQVLEDKLMASLDLSPQAEQGTSDKTSAVPIEEMQVAQSAKTGDSEKSLPVENTSTVEKAKTRDKPVYSLVELFKGIIHDLGLGFGWAAFYFTALTAVWRGQTPGKKLCGIRVIQLDGTPLSLWDSFGRYGGYGAGIATGLLGFMQIFWDANRQAIHDKISATVVVDTKAVNPRH